MYYIIHYIIICSDLTQAHEIGVYLNSGATDKAKICVIHEIKSTFKLHICPLYINTFLESVSKSTSRFLCESKAEEGALNHCNHSSKIYKFFLELPLLLLIPLLLTHP